MSLKDSLGHWLSKVSDEWIPEAMEEVGRRRVELQKRLDHLNCSLAEKALPESRRNSVSELSLKAKALAAGQVAGQKKPAKPTRRKARKTAK